MSETPTCYNPKETEEKWYKFWEENNYFKAKVNPDKKSFTIVIPPPNVTGILHMGHALNNTIQDILIRYQRMRGKEVLWMPGTDHAGIATQNVVEKNLAKEGLGRHDLGREKFIERVWVWKEQYGSTIIRQLKKLGASCDWSRTRFTMDEEYSKAVKEVFIKLWDKGLIYQDNKVINWCPRCQTALSDEEAPHKDMEGSLYYIKYPLKGLSPSGDESPQGTVPEHVVVATTRPETMLGDTAVVVNPKDKRYKKYIGKTLILPLANREIKIIADEMVDMKFGTGAVKVTPAHDPNDYILGKKHSLEFINVMHPDGRINNLGGDYKDMDRFEARQAIIKDLKERNLLEKIEPHPLSAGHCYRCHTIIEPYLSKQWFVKMGPLAKPALEAVKNGTIKFHPRRWTKVYLNWMENIQDWCISRQIWWGHRLPLYYCRKCQQDNSHCDPERSEGEAILSSKDCFVAGAPRNDKSVIVSCIKPEKCPNCGSTDIYQDEDVLDTWFSSWLWPFATFRNQEDLKYFYPTAVLVTAPEIIFFWVARMVMAGYEFMGKEPFSDVYIHGTVRDIEGKKMSKSLGNVIDPLDIIAEYGTDALRFSLISITAQGQDVFLSKERFEQGRNFSNKIWNATRFILSNIDPEVTKTDLCVIFKNSELGIFERWILSRFYNTLKQVNKNLEAYKFNEAANILYSFFWHEFCDWYLELAKLTIQKKTTQIVLYKVLEKFLRLAHPFMPFITEELWYQTNPEHGSIMISSWPHLQENMIDKKVEQKVETIFNLVAVLRNMRAELEILPQDPIKAKIFSTVKQERLLAEEVKPYIMRLARLDQLDIEEKYAHISGEFTAIVEKMHVVIPLTGVLDIASYRNKLGQKIKKAENDLNSKEAMIRNEQFVKKAPVEVVEKERQRIIELKETIHKLKAVEDGIR